MPIATGEDTSGLVSPLVTPTPVAPVNVLDVASSDYKNVAIDTRWTPISSIQAHVEGSQWTLRAYYSQVITTDSQLAGQQPTSSAVFQQYKKIEDLIIRVSSPLSQSQDPDTKTMTYAGTGLVYAGLIPNEGDMFTAAIDNGVVATFRVIGTVKKSIFRETIYEINYQIQTTDPAYLADLEDKTVDTYVYRQDFLTNGQNPMVVKSDDDLLMQLMGAYHTLSKQYFPRYFDQRYSTMIAPGQQYSIYDPFFVKFLLKAFDTTDHYLLQSIKDLNVDDMPALKQSNFWTALLNRDFSYINAGFTKIGFTSTQNFARNPYYNSIRFTGVQLCAYPLDPQPLINNAPTWAPLLEPVVYAPTPGTSTAFGIPANLAAVTNPNIPSIYPVTQDDHYVFSANFYAQTSTQSVMEGIVSAYLRGEQIDLLSLYNSTKLFMQWGALEQYYYVPIVLFLIRAAVRSYQG